MSYRDPEVVNSWCGEAIAQKIGLFGYNMEWAPGKHGDVSAIFSLATESKVLICQQLYLEEFPEHLVDLLFYRTYRKCGDILLLSASKVSQPKLYMKGGENIFFHILGMFRKRKKKNLPKVVRDMTFEVMSDLFVAVENGVKKAPENARWDKPVFTKEEVSIETYVLQELFNFLAELQMWNQCLIVTSWNEE